MLGIVIENGKKIKFIDYDLENDTMSLSKGEKVKTSLDIGDFILNVNYQNLICELEIMDPNKNLGIDKKTLGNIKEIKMSVNYKTNNIYVLLMISFNKNSKEVNIQIPLSLSLGHKKPQNQVLVYS